MKRGKHHVYLTHMHVCQAPCLLDTHACVISYMSQGWVEIKLIISAYVLHAIEAVNLFPVAAISIILCVHGYNHSVYTCVRYCTPNYAQVEAHHIISQPHVDMVILAATQLAAILWVLWHHTEGLYSPIGKSCTALTIIADRLHFPLFIP